MVVFQKTPTVDFSQNWIQSHMRAAVQLGKPLLLEVRGAPSPVRAACASLHRRRRLAGGRRLSAHGRRCPQACFVTRQAPRGPGRGLTASGLSLWRMRGTRSARHPGARAGWAVRGMLAGQCMTAGVLCGTCALPS